MLVASGALSTASASKSMPPDHGGLAHVGAELLDADLTGGESSRDLGHDPGVIVPEQLQAESLRLALHGLVRALDGYL